MGVSVWQRRAGKLSLDSSVKKHSLHGYSQGFIYCECTTLFPSTSNSPPTTGSAAHNCARASLRPHSQESACKEQSHTTLTCQDALRMILALRKFSNANTCFEYFKTFFSLQFQNKEDQTNENYTICFFL